MKIFTTLTFTNCFIAFCFSNQRKLRIFQLWFHLIKPLVKMLIFLQFVKCNKVGGTHPFIRQQPFH